MKYLITLTRHELRILLVSPATYIAAVLALMMMGFLYYLMLLALIEEPTEQMPNELFFSYFWIPVLLIVPMLTMRSVAEERRLGTLETLMTTPVTAMEVVLAKFFAAYFFYITIWALALAFPWLASHSLAQPDMTARLMDMGSILGGFLFICVSGMLFVAVGIFSSSLTRSQLVAGMLTFSILFILMVGATTMQFIDSGTGNNLPLLSTKLLEYLQVFQHYEDFVRGMIDSRPFVYYLSCTAMVLGLASFYVEAKS